MRTLRAGLAALFLGVFGDLLYHAREMSEEVFHATGFEMVTHALIFTGISVAVVGAILVVKR